MPDGMISWWPTRAAVVRLSSSAPTRAVSVYVTGVCGLQVASFVAGLSTTLPLVRIDWLAVATTTPSSSRSAKLTTCEALPPSKSSISAETRSVVPSELGLGKTPPSTKCSFGVATSVIGRFMPPPSYLQVDERCFRRLHFSGEELLSGSVRELRSCGSVDYC